MISLGIYEKALPRDISWEKRLELAKELGFNFVELSIDESDKRLARLDWSEEKIAQINAAIKKNWHSALHFDVKWTPALSTGVARSKNTPKGLGYAKKSRHTS